MQPVFFAGGVLTALANPCKTDLAPGGGCFLPPTTGSCYPGVARALLPQGERQMGYPTPDWCDCEMFGHIDTLENPLSRQPSGSRQVSQGEALPRLT